MNTYSFQLHLKSAPFDDEELDAKSDELYGVIDDGTFAVISGEAKVWFDRESSSFVDAVQTAVRDVESVGFHVVSIDTEESQTVRAVNEQLKTHQPTEPLALAQC